LPLSAVQLPLSTVQMVLPLPPMPLPPRQRFRDAVDAVNAHGFKLQLPAFLLLVASADSTEGVVLKRKRKAKRVKIAVAVCLGHLCRPQYVLSKCSLQLTRCTSDVDLATEAMWSWLG